MPKPPTNNYVHHCCRTWACNECFLAHEHSIELCQTLDVTGNFVESNKEEVDQLIAIRTDLLNEQNKEILHLAHPYKTLRIVGERCVKDIADFEAMPKPPTNNYVHHCCRTMACNECFLAHEHAIDLCHTLELIGVLNEKNQEDVDKIIAIRKDLLDEYFQIQHVLRLSPFNHWWNVDFLSHRAQQRNFRPHAPVKNLPHRLGRVCEGKCGENSSSSSS
ncbi:hypothetical protein V9T40_009593 [Parthenolecanium corni]|uniref:Uncharacterized protein n=1 Tax=Parthenolecanium corni TaxID=536013 RepID=A0AAN9TNS9_9HEMI